MSFIYLLHGSQVAPTYRLRAICISYLLRAFAEIAWAAMHILAI